MVNKDKSKKLLLELINDEFGADTAELYELYFSSKSSSESFEIAKRLFEEVLGKKKTERLLESFQVK